MRRLLAWIMPSRAWSPILAIAAVALTLLALGSLADRHLANIQLDLTEDRLFSLAPGTRQVLDHLSDPVTLTLYASPQLGASVPAMGSYGDRVVELLRRYVDAAGGRLVLRIENPEPFSDVEDAAVAAGLTGVPVDRTGERVYFGLVGSNLLDDQGIIGFFQPQREAFLEYDVTRLIQQLSDPRRAVVGLLSPLPLDGDMRRMMAHQPGGAPALSVLQLREAYDVRTLPVAAQVIDPAIQVLVVAHPRGLPDATLYAIDQFVLRGGRLLLLVDPHSEAEAALAPPDATAEQTASDVPRLLAAWGVGYDRMQVVGDLDGAWRVRAGPDESVQAIGYPAWFNLRDGIARDDPATADLSQLSFASPGALSPLPDTAMAFTPLVRSSERSGLIPVDQLAGQPDPVAVLAGFHPDGQRRVLAARLRGAVASAFAGPPPLPPGQTRPADFPAHLSRSAGPADIVVVADSDVLDDRFWVRVDEAAAQPVARPFSDNGTFLVNVVGSLAGGDTLLGLRGKGGGVRPLTAIDRLQREAELRYRRTERELRSHLDEVVKRVADLRSGQNDPLLTAERQAQDRQLNEDIAATRTRLRAVQLDLRREVDALQSRWRWFCVALVPALVAVAAILRGLRRSVRPRAATS